MRTYGLACPRATSRRGLKKDLLRHTHPNLHSDTHTSLVHHETKELNINIQPYPEQKVRYFNSTFAGLEPTRRAVNFIDELTNWRLDSSSNKRTPIEL